MKRTNFIYGVGTNDSDYKVSKMVDGKQVICPFYRRWKNMMLRCYSYSYQQRNKSYIGCTVSKGWLSFMAFRQWMINQDWEGKSLDKDIINPGNKIYSKDNCCFVDERINNLLCDSLAIRGKYPIGVKLHKPTGRFTARMKVDSNQISLGYFDTEEDASSAYITAKCSHLIKIAREQLDPRVKCGLILHANKLKLGIK